jgi:GSH-dependent disulfide-bond oxidoreductase
LIDLYFWPTPNAYKILLLLEESGLEYRIKATNILRGDQFNPDFLEISPNNRIPAIVDHDSHSEIDSIKLFESGCILIYLAEKLGKFLPATLSKRYHTYQWLMWQMGGIGPMMGQANHFLNYAPESIPYAKKRYIKEVHRLFRVAEKQLFAQDYFIGEYSIADMACYPWIKDADKLTLKLSEYPRVKDWVDRISDRPATQRTYILGEQIGVNEKIDDQARHILFGIENSENQS